METGEPFEVIAVSGVGTGGVSDLWEKLRCLKERPENTNVGPCTESLM